MKKEFRQLGRKLSLTERVMWMSEPDRVGLFFGTFFNPVMILMILLNFYYYSRGYFGLSECDMKFWMSVPSWFMLFYIVYNYVTTLPMNYSITDYGLYIYNGISFDDNESFQHYNWSEIDSVSMNWSPLGVFTRTVSVKFCINNDYGSSEVKFKYIRNYKDLRKKLSRYIKIK